MKTVSKILNFLSSVFLGGLLFFVVFTIASNSSLFGQYRSFLIQSGSMEPTIMTGDIIIIKEANQYNINDSVTFKTGERVVTHRIIEMDKAGEGERFITKGDANRSADDENISKEQILGKVVFVLPKLGFLVHFARTVPGLILLVMVPTLALIIDRIVALSDNKVA